MAWDIAEYVAGFGVVLLHEFGHVLACRWVGVRPIGFCCDRGGGLAFVTPRPGTVLIPTKVVA